MTNYYKLLITLVISFAIMYSVMFLNVDSLDHVYVSTTRIYMTLLMISPMAILMILMMKKMFSSKKINTAIVFGSLTLFALSLVFLRTQTFIGDRQYMKAMIPHHSSALLTSKNANLEDEEVKELAQQIIEAQNEEIELMKRLLEK